MLGRDPMAGSIVAPAALWQEAHGPLRSTHLQIRLVQVAYDDREPMGERVTRVAEVIRRQRGADLVVLPELWAHGAFAYEDWPGSEEVLAGPTIAAVSEAARSAGATVHAGSILEGRAGTGERPDQRRNTSVVVGPDGRILATYRKIHRFGFSGGEPSLIGAGDRVVTMPLTVASKHCTVILGLATCYDLRFPELFRQLVDAGSEVFVVPAGWPADRVKHWTLLGRARAVENQAFMLQCNTAGTHAGLEMGGCSQVVSPTGNVLARAGTGEEVLHAEIDVCELHEYRRDFPVLSDRRL